MTSLTNLAISFLLDAPLTPYEAFRDAQRRAAATEKRFYITVLSVGVFASIWISHRIVNILRRIPPGAVPDAVTSPPRQFLSFVCWALAVVCAVATFYVLYLRFTTDLPSSSFFLIAALISFGGSLLTQGNRFSTPLAEDVLASDTRPPILFLRSFAEEETGFRKSGLWGLPFASEQLEEVVLEEFKKVGPVVGLTNPTLHGRPIAYAPYDTPSLTWQTRVDELVKRAAIIAVVVARTDGLNWEIRLIKDKGYLSRTIFIFPPVDVGEAIARYEWLQSQLGSPTTRLAELQHEVNRRGHQPLTMRVVDTQSQVYLESPNANGYAAAVKIALKAKNRIP